MKTVTIADIRILSSIHTRFTSDLSDRNQKKSSRVTLVKSSSFLLPQTPHQEESECQFLYLLKLPTRAAGSSGSGAFSFPEILAHWSLQQSRNLSMAIMRKKRQPTIMATPITAGGDNRHICYERDRQEVQGFYCLSTIFLGAGNLQHPISYMLW